MFWELGWMYSNEQQMTSDAANMQFIMKHRDISILDIQKTANRKKEKLCKDK
jgi:hypothetical protein